jgi:hypothetical protein
MAPYLMNHYLRKYLIKIWCVLTIIYRNKLFTDEFQYLKWIIKCTEIVYIYNNGIIYTIRRVKIIILLMLTLVSSKIDTYLTSLWRHERYLFSVFRGILPAIFRQVVFILFLCYITVTCRHTIVFYGKYCFSNIKTSSERL